MTEDNVQQNISNNEPPQQVASSNKKSNNSSCIWIAIAFATVSLFVLLGVIAGGIYWYTKNQETHKKDVASQITQELLKEKASKSNATKSISKTDDYNEEVYGETPAYFNDEFGFDLQMLPGWEKFKVKEEFLGGDFNVAEVRFYLPTKSSDIETDVPGYMHMFTVSIYVTESWEDPERDHTNDDMLGEVVGSNDFYTFVYSHFNGVPPSDISQETVLNMDKMVNNIDTYQSDTDEYDDSEMFDDVDYDAVYSDYYQFSDVYAQNSIRYWNCMYRYQFNYPVTWSNNGMSNISDKVVLRGDNVVATIRTEDATGMTGEEFFVKEYKKEFPKAVLEPESDKLLMPETNTVIYHLAFAAPYERRLYWKVTDAGEEGKEVGIVMTIKGSGFEKEWDNIINMLGTLEVNVFMEECVS
jgi:hypothetical protein